MDVATDYLCSEPGGRARRPRGSEAAGPGGAGNANRAHHGTVLDALGARLDRATADTFDPGVLRALVVGRPVGD